MICDLPTSSLDKITRELGAFDLKETDFTKFNDFFEETNTSIYLTSKPIREIINTLNKNNILRYGFDNNSVRLKDDSGRYTVIRTIESLN